MNFTKAALFSFVFIVVISCSKDDDPTPAIAGKWTVSASKLNLRVNGQPLMDFLIGVGISTSDAQAIIDSYSDGFSADGAGVIFEFKTDGTYTEQNGPLDANPTTGKWTLDKKNLTLTDDTNPSYKPTGVITDFSDTSMSIDLKVKSDNDLGFQVDYIVSIVMAKS
ncbi:MAG: lipocalin family protein [Bacteroidota bacterium]